MATIPQTFANHTRWHAPFHFFVIPVMLINFIWSIVVFIKVPGWNSGWWIIVSLALVVLAFLVRLNSLKVQDRLTGLKRNFATSKYSHPRFANRQMHSRQDK